MTATAMEIHTPQPVAPAPSNAVTPMEMLDRALANGASMETLEKLMNLQERWEKNQARRAFDEAMAAAKAEIGPIRKNREVDFTNKAGQRTNYRHEDLAEIARTVNPILGAHGLSYRYRTTSLPNEPVSVTCIVSHRLGYFEENTLTGPRDDSGNKNAIQQVGSTLTYLQRMTLKAALGLAAAEDDDGKAAGVNEETGTISDEQAQELRKLIETVGAEADKFCRRWKIDAVPDLPAAKFAEAKGSLERWAQQNRGQA